MTRVYKMCAKTSPKYTYLKQTAVIYMIDYSRIVPAYYRFERSRIPMRNDRKNNS